MVAFFFYSFECFSIFHLLRIVHFLFIRAVILKDIRFFSLEILQVSDNIMYFLKYILDDVEEYNALKSVFPGKSRRQLGTAIELFYIAIYRAAYAISLLRY